MTTNLLKLATINTSTIEEILERLNPNFDHVVPNWTENLEHPVSTGLDELAKRAMTQPTDALCPGAHDPPQMPGIMVMPSSPEEIRPPFSYRGRIVVERMPDVGSSTLKGEKIQVYDLKLVPGDSLLPMVSPLPFSLIGRTIKIHRQCKCRATCFHDSGIILQVLVRDDGQPGEFESHLLIRDVHDEEVIFSRLFGESYIARQVVRKHMVNNTFGQITPEIAARARLHSVVFCGELLRKSRASHNGSVMILGKGRTMISLVKAVRSQKSEIQRDLCPKTMKMADLKKLVGGPKHDNLSWLLKKWLPRFHRRDDGAYLLIGSPSPDQADIEVPGGKRDWFPGEEEPSVLCALRELYEECGICVSQRAWNQFVREEQVLTDSSASQNIFILRLDDQAVFRKCKNGLIVIDVLRLV